MDQVRDKVAVITGGASGFGKEFARLGAALGMKQTACRISAFGWFCMTVAEPRCRRSSTCPGMPIDNVR